MAHSRPFGFDVEWRPDRSRGQEHPIALVQLADTRYVLLLHLSLMQGVGEYRSLSCFQVEKKNRLILYRSTKRLEEYS